MKKYKILIAEDDALISEVLKEYLEEMGHTVCGIVSDVFSAEKHLNRHPDFVFLDIRMHGKDTGFEIAKIIQTKYHVPFLFLTSFSDMKTVTKAQEYNPAAYLVKPFRKENIFAALEIAVNNSQKSNPDIIKIKDGKKTYLLNTNDIFYLQANGNYIDIFTSQKKITIKSSLEKCSKSFPDFFIKSHRAYYVNSKKITEITATFIKINNISIPLSRTFKKNFA